MLFESKILDNIYFYHLILPIFQMPVHNTFSLSFGMLFPSHFPWGGELSALHIYNCERIPIKTSIFGKKLLGTIFGKINVTFKNLLACKTRDILDQNPLSARPKDLKIIQRKKSFCERYFFKKVGQYQRKNPFHIVKKYIGQMGMFA